jgi:hypothetical protein
MCVLECPLLFYFIALGRKIQIQIQIQLSTLKFFFISRDLISFSLNTRAGFQKNWYDLLTNNFLQTTSYKLLVNVLQTSYRLLTRKNFLQAFEVLLATSYQPLTDYLQT